MNISMEETSTYEQFTTPATGYTKFYYRSVKVDADGDVPTVLIHEPNPFEDTRTFREELDYHKHNPIWGFQYGEEVARKTRENVLGYQNQFLVETSYSVSNYIPYTETHTFTPLPLISFGDNEEVWHTMVQKEEATANRRSNRLFENPTSSLAMMRAVLIDWLTEVSQTYQLKRVTFYLAVDYLDRFLTIKPSVHKSYLQLIGITSLFIAGKVEEIYPPKLNTLCSLCDGACNEEDILNCEMLLLNTLGWEVNSVTPPEWLNLYMQIHYHSNYVGPLEMYTNMNYDFVIPQYSGHHYIHMSNLIDLFALDPGFIYFKYSVIAASAMYFFHGAAVIHRVSGLTWDDVKDCIDYMMVYYTILTNSDEPQHRVVTPCTNCNYCNSVVETYRYLNGGDIQLIMSEVFSLQTYVSSLKYFERAIFVRLEQMGYYACEVCLKNDEQGHTRLYAVQKILWLEEKYLNTAEGTFCGFVPDILNSETITFQDILARITNCANRVLISRRIR